MSNPTPILNNINAFDATKGTTISFNIIGGTDIVRSNIAYIYDLSTNDLICTHLYISTESIHELPPNTDPSIVYASGKSSEDFVNNKNYYLQIQTFTNTAGTAGGSGMSVAKTFWCLFNPALSVNAIPAAISTTSYNVGATYTTNITDVTIPVTNIIQQYKFDLYTATGTLVQTSGNIIGSGEQEGTSTTYNITYNFSGLVVNNSYYVVVTTTSTEGMTVSAQSNTFTVSIDTPTVGGAIVNNNACDGYISVVSNLSDEYGGHVSGEIASFETDSVNNVSSLKVNMEPIQDLHGYDKPWSGGNGANIIDVDNPLTFTTTKTVTFAKPIPSGTTVYTYASSHTYATEPSSGTKTIAMRFEDANNQVVGITYATNTGTYNTTLTGDAVRVLLYSNGYNYTDSAGVTVTVADLMLSKSAITSYSPYSNICPISGWDSVSANVMGKNLFNGEYMEMYRLPYPIPKRTWVTASAKTSGATQIYYYDENGEQIDYFTLNVTDPNDSSRKYRTFQISQYESMAVPYYIMFKNYTATEMQFEIAESASSLPSPYEAPTTYTTDLNQTVYGGTLDLVTGVLTVDRAMIEPTSIRSVGQNGDGKYYWVVQTLTPLAPESNVGDLRSNLFKTGAAVSGGNCYITGYGKYIVAVPVDQTLNTKELADDWMQENHPQFCYLIKEPQTYQLTPHQIQTLVGQNNVWSDAGDVDVTFNLPITNLLVKRQDTSDTSGKWLTLYSQPITQASDMDFTYIDFLNQHGKTYRYALVPLLTQQQGDVDVEIEGGYTVSDDVLSVFDGVFIANSNGSQKLKATTEYGDLETNQDVGVLATIGNKYPFVVSNSNLNYHSGSISALIVPSDFYTSGDLDRLDIVERREAIEQFLTDKTAKILKDWNGNIWLITFVENVEVSFVDDYGMGLGTLSAKWVEIGDVNDQTDLKQTGLI